MVRLIRKLWRAGEHSGCDGGMTPFKCLSGTITFGILSTDTLRRAITSPSA